jgi:hypothetical protein
MRTRKGSPKSRQGGLAAFRFEPVTRWSSVLKFHRSPLTTVKWWQMAAALPLAGIVTWLLVDASTNNSSKTPMPSSISAELNGSSAARIQTLRAWVLNAHGGMPPTSSWCLTGPTIQPCADLRSRFDYYLIAANRAGTTYSDIRELVQTDANTQAAPASGQIIALFDRYWLLQHYAWKQAWLDNDPSTWLAAKSERDKVRHELLGEAWAKVFYAQENQPYLISAKQNNHQSQDIQQVPIASAPTAQDMVSTHWPDISEDEKIQRAKELSKLMPPLRGSKDQAERKMLIAQAQWIRLQQEDSLSADDKKAAMQEFIQDTFEPNEYEAVTKVLKIN